MQMKSAGPSRRHPSCDGSNCLRSSNRRHPSCDGSNCLRSSNRRHPSCDGSNCLRSSNRRHPSCDGSNCLRSSSRRHPSCDGCNCLRSSSRRHPSCDGCNCLSSSSRRHASKDGCKCLHPSRREDSAIHTRLRTCRPKLTRSTIIIITSVIAAWLLPEVSAVVSQNETKPTSPTWDSTGSDSMINQSSNASGISSWSQVSWRGDNPSYSGDNSSLSVLLPPNQPNTVERGFRNASKENSEKSVAAVSAGVKSQEQEDVSKIISIVVPFTCVIFVAAMLCVTYKLCHRYRCYNNKPNLTKCLTFCDRCMSTPYVFQLSDDKKDSNRTTSVSSDSGRLFRYSVNSVSSSSSRISTTPSPSANNTHRHSRQTPGAQYSRVRHSSSSSSHSETSRPGPSPRLSSTSSSHSGLSPRLSSTSSSHSGISSQSPRSLKPRLGAITSGRQSSDLTSASNPASVRSTAMCQDLRHPQAKQPTTGQSQRPSFHLSRQLQRPSFHLSRQSHTAGCSRASGQSRDSVQSPSQPHRVPSAIYQRQDSAR